MLSPGWSRDGSSPARQHGHHANHNPHNNTTRHSRPGTGRGSKPGAATPAHAHRWTAAFACGAAYATHPLLDWMGNDTTPPIGIMALWPFTSEYYESNLHFFMAITRRYWLPGFWTHNLIAMFREIGTLVPLAVLVYFWRRRRARAV
jgi:hypothetical protein